MLCFTVLCVSAGKTRSRQILQKNNKIWLKEKIIEISPVELEIPSQYFQIFLSSEIFPAYSSLTWPGDITMLFTFVLFTCKQNMIKLITIYSIFQKEGSTDLFSFESNGNSIVIIRISIAVKDKIRTSHKQAIPCTHRQDLQ